MDRAEKQEFEKTLNGSFNEAGVIVVAHYSGLSVAEMTDLRNRMKDAGASVKVAKNRLAKLALEDTPAKGIQDLFTGPTCIATSARSDAERCSRESTNAAVARKPR